jgi:cation diffusion facilitator CzcD-associated flavoprotein CzcO
MPVNYETGIVGAGFGGIIAALELQRTGHGSFVIFERAHEVGGVWRENIYPGCACDVRSHLYSIETQPNPDWTESYASQPEILRYLKDVVRRNRLEEHIRFGANVSQVRFLADDACWEIHDENGDEHGDENGSICRVKMLILATGPHSRPRMPSFPGQSRFSGEMFHSAAWAASVKLAGKRVAVVGSGASAVQIVPNIAAEVSHLDVFQRSAPWVLPRGSRRIGGFSQWLFRRVPALQTLARKVIYWAMEFVGLAFMGNDRIGNWFSGIALRKLAREVKDPVVRAKLTPNYRFGCKRVLVSDDFYPAFNRPNVALVTENIARIEPNGIRTDDGCLHEADVIVLATGFIVADTDNYLRVVGMDGRVLADEWNREGCEAYLGINVAGYPNMALLLGPNSGLSHSSALHVMESQMRYIVQYLERISNAGTAWLDVKPEVQSLYNVKVQSRLVGTVWAAGCTSWYLNRDGRNAAIYPGLTWQYRRATAQWNANDYVAVGAEKPSRTKAMASRAG